MNHHRITRLSEAFLIDVHYDVLINPFNIYTKKMKLCENSKIYQSREDYLKNRKET